MQEFAAVTEYAESNGDSTFVMIPVDKWNALVDTLNHYERIDKLRTLSAQMDEDPAQYSVPWDKVRQELSE